MRRLIAALDQWFRWLRPMGALTEEPTRRVEADPEAWRKRREEITKRYHCLMGVSEPVINKGARGNDTYVIEAAFRWPHCDDLVLHRPKECEICDRYATDLQQKRIAIGMNFTGETDPTKVPDPATESRDFKTLNRWGGNSAKVAVVINGQEHMVTRAGRISFNDVVFLAKGWEYRNPEAFSVTYRLGRGLPGNIMHPGEELSVCPGMIFSAYTGGA